MIGELWGLAVMAGIGSVFADEKKRWTPLRSPEGVLVHAGPFEQSRV